MQSWAAIAIVMLFGGCAQLPDPQQGQRLSFSKDWLIGGWIPQGESCESDAGVRYDADGTWTAYEGAGTWRLNGFKLLTVVTEKWTDGEEVPVKAAEHHVERIEAVGPDSYRSHRIDGTVVTLQRCPNWPD